MSAHKVYFHGAAKEVGRSCIEVEHSGSRYLMDAGLKLLDERDTPPEYPTQIEYLDNIDCVFLSHSHLDHCGALPLLNQEGLECPIYCTSLTKALVKIMLEDSLKVEKLEGNEPAYEKANIQQVLKMMQPVEYNTPMQDGKIQFTLHDAGHIPGSASIEVKTGEKRLLYTGDFTTVDSELLKGAQYDKSLHGMDVMITESTYGDRDHPGRRATEEDFITRISDTYAMGGSVVIPVFAMGRTQEVLMMIKKSLPDLPVYLDGMGQKLTRIMLQHPDFLRDSGALQSAFDGVHCVKGWKDRAEIIKERGIFITTSGMVEGGPVYDYLEHLWFDAKSSILLTGYQAHNTNGRKMLDGLPVTLRHMNGEENEREIRCFVNRYDFSTHAGREQIIDFVKMVEPKNLLLQHGDPGVIESLSTKLSDYNVQIPENDKPLELE